MMRRASVAATESAPSVLSMTGRPSKGDRVMTACRPFRPVRQALDEMSVEAGFDNLGDYLSAVLAEHAGLPEYAPAPRRHREEQQLPLSA